MMFLSLWLVANLYARPTLPDECRFVRLDSHGSSMEFVPVRDQENLGASVAETAAQMLDAWRFSHGKRDHKTQTFAVAAAKGINGASSCPAVKAILENGSCEQLEAVENALAKNGLRGFLKKLEASFANYRTSDRQFYIAAHNMRRRRPAQVKAPTAADRKHDKRLAAAAKEVTRQLKASGFTTQMIPPTKSLKLLLEQKNQNVFMQGILKHSCAFNPHRDEKTPPSCQSIPAQGKNELSLELRHRLSQPNAQPVALRYCDGVLKKGRYYRGLASRGHGCFKKASQSSLVIGMRPGFSAQSCQFLIRNSVGTNCEGYSHDWECDRGDLWVDSRALLENTRGLSALEAPASR